MSTQVWGRESAPGPGAFAFRTGRGGCRGDEEREGEAEPGRPWPPALTRVGVITGPDEMVEAVWPRVMARPWRESWERNPEGMRFLRPLGETPRSVEALVRQAQALVGMEFSLGGIFAQVFGRRINGVGDISAVELPERFACELALTLLLASEPQRSVALPKALMERHPGGWRVGEMGGTK